MCLILFAWRAHPRYALVFAANRDENYDRPSRPAGFWHDAPRVYGGRDLERQGTWLAITLDGRLAAVTNFRDGAVKKEAPRSRGELVARFVREGPDPRAYLEDVSRRAGDYGGFGLIVGDLEQLWFGSNRGGAIEPIAPGVHGLSNHLLDTPWPKVRRGTERLRRLLGAGESELREALFALLGDRTPAPDSELPDTGVGLERERELSPPFIAGERYGTRASTVLLVGHDGETLFVERRFGPRGVPLGDSERRFLVSARDGARRDPRAGAL